MARVLIRTQSWGTVQDRHGEALPSLTYALKNTDGSAATHWSAQTGGSSSTATLTTDSFGVGTLSGADRWVEQGEYDLVTNGTTYRVEALNAASVVSVSRYWAPSGGDDSAAFAAAIASGGTHVLGPGTFLWNTQTPTLSRSTPVRIIGSGIGETTIKLSTSAPSFLSLNKVADYDTFSDIEISDLTIDRNSVNPATSNHIVVGTLAGGATMTKINMLRWGIRRIRTINVPTNTSPGAANTANFYLVALVNEADNACNINDIVFEDLDLNGGSIGVSVGGTTNDSSGDGHLFHDRIYVTRVKHDTGVINTGATFPGENIQIGQKDTGGTVTIRDCHGYGAQDVGIAVLNGRFSQVEDCTVTDARTLAFQAANFNPNMPADQTHAFKSCHVKLVQLNPSFGGAYPAQGFGGTGSPNQQYGNLVLEDCTWHSLATNAPPQGTAINITNPVSNVRILGQFHMNATAINQTLSTNIVAGLVSFTPTGTSSFTVRGALRSNIAGTITLSGHAFQWTEFQCPGLTSSNYNLDVDTHYVNYGLSGVAANTFFGAAIGPGTVLTTPLPIFRGTYRMVVETHTSADTGPTGINFNAYGGASQQITIQPLFVCPDCDFSPFPSGSVGREVISNSALTGNSQALTGTGQYPLVRYPRITLANNDDNFSKGSKSFATTNATGASSGVNVTNATGWPMLVWFDQALTGLTWNRRNDTNVALTITSPSTGFYYLAPGDGLYSAAAATNITWHGVPIKNA